MKYIKKQIEIEAIQYTKENLSIIKQFVKGSLKNKDDKFFISTLEGDVEMRNNDYVIKGINGEFYPCSDKKFKDIYTHIEGTLYKKKSIEVEAVKYNGHIESICDFCSLYKMDEKENITIPTSDNRWLEVSNGDYVVKETDGGYHPVKPDIFEKTYEEKK